MHAGEAESEEGDEDDDDDGDDEDFEDDEHEKSKSDKSYLVIIKLKEYQITGDKLYQVIKVKLKVDIVKEVKRSDSLKIPVLIEFKDQTISISLAAGLV